MEQSVFPSLKRNIEDFLYEEEGNIPRGSIPNSV